MWSTVQPRHGLAGPPPVYFCSERRCHSYTGAGGAGFDGDFAGLADWVEYSAGTPAEEPGEKLSFCCAAMARAGSKPLPRWGMGMVLACSRPAGGDDD